MADKKLQELGKYQSRAEVLSSYGKSETTTQAMR